MQVFTKTYFPISVFIWYLDCARGNSEVPVPHCQLPIPNLHKTIKFKLFGMYLFKEKHKRVLGRVADWFKGHEFKKGRCRQAMHYLLIY
jgi:hypothetical protein